MLIDTTFTPWQSLAGGGLIVTFIGYRFVLKRPAPVLDATFHLPTKRDLDTRLIGGSAVFGVGWGIAGFCPGGAIPVLGKGVTDVFIFMAALLAGIAVAKAVQNHLALRAVPA